MVPNLLLGDQEVVEGDGSQGFYPRLEGDRFRDFLLRRAFTT